MALPVADRLEALRRLASKDLAWLFGRVPALAEALEGSGPLRSFAPYGGLPQPSAKPSLNLLASLLATPTAINFTLASLNRFEFQLTALASWHGGVLTRAVALAEVGHEHGAALDEALGVLTRLLLVDSRSGWLTLRPGVDEIMGFPGMRVREGLEWQSAQALGDALRHLGKRLPSRKADRLSALEAALRDRATIERVLAKAPKDALRVFGLLAEHGPQRVRDLGIPYYVWYASQRTPLHWLVQHGLVGADVDAQVAWVWFDVIVALNGRLFTDWAPAPPAVSLEPLTDPGAGLPLVLGRLSSLLDLWAAEPAPALASGGLGVRPVRAAAKALGLEPGEVGLLAHLAVGLGLLGTTVVGSKGSGRNRTELLGWAPTDLAAQWRTEAPARQWALLIQTWRDDLTLDESEGLPERSEGAELMPFSGVVRTALLRLLVELAPERGLPLDALTAVASFRHPALLDAQRVQGVVEAARVLGLVPATGPVGLTRLGRAVLDGPDAVEAALPPPRAEFTVQADQSVIAPPDLALDVSMTLERLADIESTAGARIYRLSERRIAAALDDGETAASLLDFLERHSTVPLAQNITHLIRDCERRHGRLRAGTAASYLRCDDPALLTSAVGVKAAKLRLLAPTVAVSPLERDKLVAALRGRGLMPVAESPDGATLARQEKVAARKHRSDGELPPLRRNGVLLDPGALEALAKATLANDDSRAALRLLPQS